MNANELTTPKFKVGQKVTHADIVGGIMTIAEAYVHPGWEGQSPYACYKICDIHESYVTSEEHKMALVQEVA